MGLAGLDIPCSPRNITGIAIPADCTSTYGNCRLAPREAAGIRSGSESCTLVLIGVGALGLLAWTWGRRESGPSIRQAMSPTLACGLPAFRNLPCK